MRYGSLVSLAAALFALGAYELGAPVGYILVWPALSFGFVALGYFGLGAWMLGKTKSGSRKAWGYLLAGPFIAFMHGLRFLLTRARFREDAWNEVADGLYVGRILPLEELPKEAATVIDMTSEHVVDPALRASKHYVCLPTLDGSVAALADVVALLKERDSWKGAIYVHCAAGHGRSAMVAACLVVLGGFADTIDEAVTLMKRQRPKVHLVPLQRSTAIRALHVLASGSEE